MEENKIFDGKTDRYLRMFSMALGIGGFVLIGIFAHWAAAIGVFLMFWGNNLQILTRIFSKMPDLLDTLRDAMDKRYIRKP